MPGPWPLADTCRSTAWIWGRVYLVSRLSSPSPSSSRTISLAFFSRSLLVSFSSFLISLLFSSHHPSLHLVLLPCYPCAYCKLINWSGSVGVQGKYGGTGWHGCLLPLSSSLRKRGEERSCCFLMFSRLKRRRGRCTAVVAAVLHALKKEGRSCCCWKQGGRCSGYRHRHARAWGDGTAAAAVTAALRLKMGGGGAGLLRCHIPLSSLISLSYPFSLPRLPSYTQWVARDHWIGVRSRAGAMMGELAVTCRSSSFLSHHMHHCTYCPISRLRPVISYSASTCTVLHTSLLLIDLQQLEHALSHYTPERQYHWQSPSMWSWRPRWKDNHRPGWLGSRTQRFGRWRAYTGTWSLTLEPDELVDTCPAVYVGCCRRSIGNSSENANAQVQGQDENWNRKWNSHVQTQIWTTSKQYCPKGTVHFYYVMRYEWRKRI